MPYLDVDKIVEISSGKSIQVVRKLQSDESYLEDHFPLFPVMPGVLMLETMFQASAWLVRASCDFEEVVVRLAEAKNMKFQDFVEPGMELTVTAEIVKQVGPLFTLKIQGMVEDRLAASGRLVVERYQMANREPEHGFVDGVARAALLEKYAELTASITT